MSESALRHLDRRVPAQARLIAVLLDQLRALPSPALRLPQPRAETGMTLGRWRQQLRLVEALRRLAAGQAVTSVALDVGYESPSAFVSVFRRTFGTTPGRYFRQRPRPA